MNRQFRILLVEDDPSDALLALTMVNEVNLAGEALHVADSVLALDYLHARGAFVDRAPGLPAVVLLDLKLPRLDGFEVLQHVRTTPAPQLVPIGYRKNKRPFSSNRNRHYRE